MFNAMATSSRLPQPASSTFEFASRSPDATQQLGEALGRQLASGDVVALIGELGSGKTTFVQGIARGLGVDERRVKSPTFVVMREHPGRIPLIHVDAYRLDDAVSAVSLDLDWIFSPRRVTLIEWADRIPACLPAEYLEIRLAHKSTHQRLIIAVPHGNRGERIVHALRLSSVERSADSVENENKKF